jgi:hypothetical protein
MPRAAKGFTRWEILGLRGSAMVRVAPSRQSVRHENINDGSLSRSP